MKEINYRKKTRQAKHMESKQHASKKPIGQWQDQSKKESTSRQVKNRNTTF